MNRERQRHTLLGNIWEWQLGVVCLVDLPRGSRVHWERMSLSLRHNPAVTTSTMVTGKLPANYFYFFFFQYLFPRSRLLPEQMMKFDRLHPDFGSVYRQKIHLECFWVNQKNYQGKSWTQNYVCYFNPTLKKSLDSDTFMKQIYLFFPFKIKSEEQ